MVGGWIGVDLDGTLAQYDGWKGIEHIGEPIPAMVDRVKGWLAEGKEVRIFTARVYRALELEMSSNPKAHDRVWEAHKTLQAIRTWSVLHIGQVLKVTCMKDMGMIELWDDRAVQVSLNTGVTARAAALECAAMVCEYHATLADSILETNCSSGASLCRSIAAEIRKLKEDK